MQRLLFAVSLIAFLGGCGGESGPLSDGRNDGSTNDDGGTTDDGSTIDGGDSACVWTGANAGRPDLEPGRLTSDGCNECSCGEPGIACTGIGCGMQQSRCSTQADCGVGSFCHFDPGCVETMGYCMVGQSRCKDETNPVAPAGQTGVVCGCDGTNYEATDCFGIRWERYGPC